MRAGARADASPTKALEWANQGPSPWDSEASPACPEARRHDLAAPPDCWPAGGGDRKGLHADGAGCSTHNDA